MTDTLAALQDLARERTERDGLVAARTATRRRLEEARARVRDARSRLHDENADVAELESFSMTRVLASLRGSRDTDLDRERAEAQAAAYAVADAEARLAVQEREDASLEQRIAAYGDLAARHEELLARREEEVRADPAGAARAAGLTTLAERVGDLQAQDVQLHEARAAAQQATLALDETARQLGSAGAWSTYDTFFGGGMVSSMVKHDKLDRVAVLVRQADAALSRLSTELADVGLEEVGDIGVTSMTRALDIWFDNIFSDWAVRERIARVSERVEGLRRQLLVVAGELARLRQEVAHGLEHAAAERERLLLDTV